MSANQPIISGKKYHSVSFYDAAGDLISKKNNFKPKFNLKL